MNYRLLFLLVWSKNNNNNPSLVGALPVLMLSADWITQDYYFISQIQILDQGFCCLVEWSKFLFRKRAILEIGSKRRMGGGNKTNVFGQMDLNPALLMPVLASICKRQACSNYTPAQQIERCHARMKYFCALSLIKDRTHIGRQMNTCSYVHKWVVTHGLFLDWMHPSCTSYSFVWKMFSSLRWRFKAIGFWKLHL